MQNKKKRSRRNLDEYPDAMTVEELCEFLSIGRNAAYKLIQDNEIASIRIGRLYRIPKSCVEEWLNRAYTVSAEESSAGTQKEEHNIV